MGFAEVELVDRQLEPEPARQDDSQRIGTRLTGLLDRILVAQDRHD